MMNEEDRYMKKEDIKVAEWGYYMGYATPVVKNGVPTYEYNYVKYSDADVIVEAYPSLVDAAMSPLFRIIMNDVYEEMIEGVKAMEWEHTKPDIFCSELDNAVLFVSNHIPEPVEEVTFTMLADHSKCTKDHCVEED